MKKYLLIVLLNLSLFGDDFINIELQKYIQIVSKTNQINIVIDEKIDHKISFLISKDLPHKAYFDVMLTLLKNKELVLKKYPHYYLITKQVKKKENEDLKYYSIKLNFVEFKDIENFLKVYEESVKYQYINSSKLILLKATKKDFTSIKTVINLIDTLPKQLKLKITIIDTNLDKLKEYGFEHLTQIHSDSNINYFFNLVAYPFTISNDISMSQKSQFYSFLKLINQNGNSKFISSPILTLSDNKELKFDVGTTIPYNTGSTTIDTDNSKTTTALSYKDVGLKISATPRIYNKDLVYLDLELEVSNILSNSDNTPIVSKKYIKQSFYLNSKKIFVLTGINQSEATTNINGIPLLMDIPFLGWLFKTEAKSLTTSNLSIFFEIINETASQKLLSLEDDIEYFEVIDEDGS